MNIVTLSQKFEKHNNIPENWHEGIPREDVTNELIMADALLKMQCGKNRRKNGSPTVDHPWRMLIKNWKNFNPYQRVASLIHDLMEDFRKKITPEYLLNSGFSYISVHIADAMTRRKAQGEKYFDFIRRLSHCKEAIPVKIADIEDNMGDLEPDSMEYIRYAISKKFLQKVQNEDIPPGSPIEASLTEKEIALHQKLLIDNNSDYFEENKNNYFKGASIELCNLIENYTRQPS